MSRVPAARRGTWVLLWPALFWTAGFALPLGAAAVRAAGAVSQVGELAASPYYRGIFLFTLKQAFLSTIFSVLLGLPGAFLVGRRDFPGRRVLKSLSTVPFVMPSVLAVLGFILVFGNAGLINKVRISLMGPETAPWKILYSLKAIVMAHVFYNFPLTMRLAGDAWAGLSRPRYLAARSLGAARFAVFRAVDLPRIAPAILTAAVMTFLYCFLSFAVVLVLGGGPKLSTLEVEVYRLVKYNLDFDRGSALALMESMVILGLLSFYALWEGRMRRSSMDDASGTAAGDGKKLKGWEAGAALLYSLPVILLVLAPLAAVAGHSLLVRTTRTGPPVVSFGNWLRLFGGGRVSSTLPILAVGRTFALGAAASFPAVSAAAAAAWYGGRNPGSRMVRVLGSAMALPLGVSSVMLGLGYLLLAGRLPSGDFSRLAALSGAHAMMALPFAYRIISGRFKEISPRTLQAARSLGGGSLTTFIRVEMPLIRRALVTAAIFSLALSAGELNAAAILAPGDFTTVPLAIYRMIGAYDIAGACALGTLLIAVSSMAFFVLDKSGERTL